MGGLTGELQSQTSIGHSLIQQCVRKMQAHIYIAFGAQLHNNKTHIPYDSISHNKRFVNVHHTKPYIRSGKGRQRCNPMSMNFWALAFDVRFSPLSNILVHSRPNIPSRYEAFVAWMLECKSEWRRSKIVCQNWTSTTGLRVPVDVKQVSRVPETGREMFLRSQEFGVVRSSDSSGGHIERSPTAWSQ